MVTQTVTLPSKNGEPTWEAVDRLPRQGDWTEEEFLRHFNDRGYEYVDGRVEVLPLPDVNHQLLAADLFNAARAAAEPLGGRTLFMGLRLRVPSPGGTGSRLREPDVLHVTDAQLAAATRQYVHAAEWAAEVVSSPDGRRRDLEEKRDDYARAGVKEYWIVDPRDRLILVLSLDRATGTYTEPARHADGDIATSPLLPALKVNVTNLLGDPA